MRARTRRAAVLTTLCAFALGIVVLPALHLMFHGVAHEHGGGARHAEGRFVHGPAGHHEHDYPPPGAHGGQRAHGHRHPHGHAHERRDGVDGEHHPHASHHTHAAHDDPGAVRERACRPPERDGDTRPDRESRAPAHHRPGREPFDPRHGEGSAEHYSLAVGEAVAANVELALAGFAAGSVIPASRGGFPSSAHRTSQRFRGPPSPSN